VIDDGGPNGEVSMDSGRRRRCYSRLLQGDDDVRIHPVGIFATVAKADDVQSNRREEFQFR